MFGLCVASSLVPDKDMFEGAGHLSFPPQSFLSDAPREGLKAVSFLHFIQKTWELLQSPLTGFCEKCLCTLRDLTCLVARKSIGSLTAEPRQVQWRLTSQNRRGGGIPSSKSSQEDSEIRSPLIWALSLRPDLTRKRWVEKPKRRQLGGPVQEAGGRERGHRGWQ